MKTGGKILTAFAIGAVAGVVAGILFAPDKGAETRKKLSEEGKKVAGEVKNKFREMKNKFNGMKEEAGENATEHA